MIIVILSVSLLIAVGIYMLLQKTKINMTIGVILISSGINLVLIIAGRLNGNKPAFLPNHASQITNPLPQALALTAIVFSFGLLAFLLALVKRKSK